MQIEVCNPLLHLRTKVRANGPTELVKEFGQSLIRGAFGKVFDESRHQFLEFVIGQDLLDLFNSVVEDQLCLLECFIGK